MKNDVLFILRIPPPFGGGEIVSLELYNHLKDEYKFLLINQQGHSKSKQGNVDISSYLRGIHYLSKVTMGIVYHRPQIVYIGIPKNFGSFFRNSIIYLVAKILGIKLHGEIHGMSFLFLNKKMKSWYYRKIINLFEKIRVLGNSVETYLSETGYQGEIVVINNGITPPKIAPSLMKEHGFKHNRDFNLLYFGAISESKGFFKVLEVLSILHDLGIKNWVLNIIGEWVNGKEKERAIKILSNSRYENKIIFHGKLTSEDKWTSVLENDLLMHFTDYDGQPLTIIETMSLGIPVVATKVGCIPEMIINNKNGYLIDDPQSAVKIITDLIIGKIDYSALSKKTKMIFERNYNSEIMSKKIIKMIEG